MKSTKDMVFEFLRQYMYTNEAERSEGVETRVIAQVLGKQRSNISAALNELIKEGKLIKSFTRPVLYRLPLPTDFQGAEKNELRVVGYNGSLRLPLQQARAAEVRPCASISSIYTRCRIVFLTRMCRWSN